MTRSIARDLARSLGLTSTVRLAGAPGASGNAWIVDSSDGRFVMRLERSVTLVNSRLAAMAAARGAGLPVPDLVGRATTDHGVVVLLTWLPGRTMLEALSGSPASSTTLGRLTGRVQRRLHAIHAPDDVVDVLVDRSHPFVAGRGLAGLPTGSALLHLDWHPLNLLVDDDGTKIVGILDWDNARRGHPVLDLARTEAILRVEPTLDHLPPAVRGRLDEFRESWLTAAGSRALSLPHASRVWAGKVMLADLEPRYATAPEALEPLRRWTTKWEQALTTGTGSDPSR